jgi:hypothetical protein
MPTTLNDTSKFETELRKATAESGWDYQSEKLVLLRFIASNPGNLTAFKSFLREQLEEEAFMPSGPAYHGAVAVAETEEDDDEDFEDDDFEDDDDEDFDDEDDDEDFGDDDLDEDDDDDDFEDDDEDEDE